MQRARAHLRVDVTRGTRSARIKTSTRTMRDIASAQPVRTKYLRVFPPVLRQMRWIRAHVCKYVHTRGNVLTSVS